jgi:hypothetical protein
MEEEVFIKNKSSEALQTTKIEDEYFSREDKMSPIKGNLKMKDYRMKSKK